MLSFRINHRKICDLAVLITGLYLNLLPNTGNVCDFAALST
jgi:hypothetical protein